MQEAAVVLTVLRERGSKGLPLTQLYRQMFNKNLYLLAYGNIYSNQGAMTPGASKETADGMSEGKIDQIIELMRHERYRFRASFRQARILAFWRLGFRQFGFHHIARIPRHAAPNAWARLPVSWHAIFPVSPFGVRVSHQIQRHLLQSLPAERAI